MNKNIIFVLIACIVCFLLAISACGKSSTPVPVQQEETDNQTVFDSQTESDTVLTEYTEQETEKTTFDSEKSSYDYYYPVLKGYSARRIDEASEMGYTVGIESIKYAIKDINSDGTDELVIFEKIVYADGTTSQDYNLSAIYTLDGSNPVELYFISRHGDYSISSNGYFIYSYHGLVIEKLVGTELVTVAESERMNGEEPDSVTEEFYASNGVSGEEMDFDLLTFNP